MGKDKVLDLANKISRVKRGSRAGITFDDPEYKIYSPWMSEDVAEVTLCLKLREKMSASDVAAACGRPVEEVAILLWESAVGGAAFINNVDGVDMYWVDIWVPGHMEMVVNNKELIKKYPELGAAFDAFGKKKGPLAAGNIPVGSGPMRVIPIETSIDGETRNASYEEVSKYLNNNDVFSLSDCACRTSREAMNEGCGHLKEDICIQMGHAAEYYIRTGRGREISRDDAIEVIKKAEDNGLMHSIPNLDGSGKTHAICNCCGCGCFAMRLAEQWQNPDMVRSNYTVKIDKEKCVACGECVEVCPTNAVKLGQKLCSLNPTAEKERELPHNTEWGEDKFNPDYRENKQMVDEGGTAPCKAGCPAHIGVQGYIKLASQGQYTEALKLIKMENPFPAVCGRICPKFCEDDCTRCDIDGAVAVDDIKKFIAQQDMDAEKRYIPESKNDYDKKIAVIGGGPAGLSCAYYLTIEGYKVTVFEKQHALGGMLTLGIPSYRLEKDVINAEIDVLKEMGVEFKTGVEIGKDISLAELRKQDYNAFYIAIGAQAGRSLGLDGENAEGVITGVEFLRHVNLGESTDVKGNVIVIGGGNVAIDVARTATRVGAAQVDMFCLESRENMPAHAEEVQEALDEDINVNNSWGPKRIVTENNCVVGVEFRKCISVLDENGRFNPRYDENNTKIVNADHVLLSVGQAMDWGNILENSNIALNPNQTIPADATTYQTDEPDVFAGGDVVTGPRFAIDAIAHGKEGAISIHRYVQNGQSLVLGRIRRDYRAFDKTNLNLDGFDASPRQSIAHVDGQKSKTTFHDLRETFTEDQVKLETERCLGCGLAVADEFMCVGCGACTTKCRFDAISLVRTNNAEGVDLKDAKKIIIKHALKRKVRVAVNKPVKKIKALFAKY
ncbi:Pyridine nucleotide-disulphide oxidoreductase [Moritella viscosa]|uniref:Pyridine nucleotide-disulphide oxidoreductase n=1 Tax=Moritella viscosa TaxID=80854 RepID=A0A090IDW6_9GAMM|nr:FAD-dependent oxidoreductase [Moritella viscosa]CED60226.1 pyridine nucleotide-disulphide oxidoreductase [Moritella viscosa]SGZ12715.1 Pyridine nucleotide-disulphide oxidoreductase [Moritella viscosa]SHO14264.1 Pyridine nucleotide-disulphide oxidoreductase [Moritella viscosa]SHO23534.1 Pyridine nucleotide-disulphide oxidoreductase [Moritella viscosa]